MDPISIITLIQFSSVLSKGLLSTLISYGIEVKNIDASVKALTSEIQGLDRIFSALTSSLNDTNLRLAEIGKGEYGNKHMWEALHGSIESCRIVLERLRHELPALPEHRTERSFKLIFQTIAFRLNKEDINDVRSSIASHHASLNTALHLLNLYAKAVCEAFIY